MTLQGTKTGSLQTLVNCGGIAGNVSLPLVGSANPEFGISAPPALAGNITSGTITLGAVATFAGTEKVAVFWTAGGVDYYRYDCAIAGGTGTTFALSAGAGTALPSSGQAVLLATAQDITDGVSLNGSNLQQLIATSNQPGLVEWLDVVPAQQRLSVLASANSFDTWPTAAGQTAPPASWTAATVVVTLRVYSNSLSAANVQIGAILT